MGWALKAQPSTTRPFFLPIVIVIYDPSINAIYKEPFRPSLNPFIAHFNLIVEPVFGPTHFQPDSYKTLLKTGRVRAQNGGPGR